MQDRQCILTTQEKFIDIVSYSTLQLTIKKPLLVMVWSSIKKEYPQLSEKAIILLFSYTSIKTT